MKGFAMLGAGKTGWIEKARPTCGALDAIVRPIGRLALHERCSHRLGGRARRTGRT